MSTYLRDKFGPWLRHKVRVVIVKQWKKYDTIYKNLLTLKRIIKSNLDDTSIYQAAMTRLGWYRQCGLSVFNFLLSPKVLLCQKRIGLIKERADLAWSTLMLYIRICVLLYVSSAVYETRTYGAMRGARGVIPYIYSIIINQ